MESCNQEVELSLLTKHGQEKSKKMSSDARFLYRKRYYVNLALMISWMVFDMMKTNLGICLVGMTSNKSYVLNNVTYFKEAEFHWTSIQKGLILSSFSWGRIFSPIGALVVVKLDGVKAFGIGMLATGILTLLSPMLMRVHFSAYLVGRFFEGLFEGISSASQGKIYFHWTLPDERAISITLSHLGHPLGYIVSYPVAGYLIYHLNWASTFYIIGGIAILWSFIWCMSISECPSEDKLITKVEKDYFKKFQSTGPRQKTAYPWKKLFSSVPLWALLNERFIEAWSTSFLAYCLPLYIKDVFDTNMKVLGWLSSVPQYFQLLGRILAAIFADYLRRNKICSLTTLHKSYILSAQIGAVACLFTAGIINQFQISIIVFSLFKLFFSLALVSYNSLPLDMAAQHSSFVYGTMGTARSVGHILNPIAIGLMVTSHSDTEWSRYFFFLGSLNIWAALMFAIYGSGNYSHGQTLKISLLNERLQELRRK